MSEFSDHFTEVALPALFDRMAESISYSPRGGETVTLSALLGHETIRPLSLEARQGGSGADHGRRKIARRTVDICLDPDGPYGGVAAPRINATVFIEVADELLEYAVESITSPQHGFAQLVVVRIVEMDNARPKFRGRR